MELTKIVVGIDFSESSTVAAGQALDLARHTGAQVVLVHVGIVPSTKPPPGEGSVAEWERLLREQLSADRRGLEDLRERLSGQGADVSHMVIDGFPDTGLVKAAEELGAEVIVTGSHGRTGVARWLLGSVAERTVRLSKGAVIVARKGANSGGGYRRIMVPTDFSDHAHEALRTALIVAGSDGAHIDLVHFWQLPMVGGGYDPGIDATMGSVGGLRQAIESDADRRGRELVEEVSSDHLRVTYKTVQGGAAHGVVDRATNASTPHDLIVLGSHGRRGVRRFLLGSVAETVVRHAPCSVMVVHLSGDPS
jgi:nucleotide-binding universal stress UspA family protein